MRKLRHLWILILLFGLVSMSACGQPEEETTNQEVIVDCAETVAAHQYLLKKYKELEALYERTRAREAEYITAVRTLEDAYLAQGIELALRKSLDEGKAENYEDLLNEVIALRVEKEDWGRFASQEYARILEQFRALSALYPPKNFPDKETLVEWRENSGNVTELGYLGLQKLAMDDGYMVSVCPELDYCAAIAGDYWYRITPGDRDLVEKIKKVK